MKFERSKSGIFSSCIISMSVLLSAGCSSSGSSNTELQNRIADLESENKSLKSELTILKDSFGKAKTLELQNALTGTGTGTGKSEGAIGGAETAASGSSEKSGSDNIAANTQAVPFIDLEETPTKELIEQLSRLRIFDDLGNKFNPNEKISRAEYIEWLYKAYNALEPESKQIRFAPQAAQIFKDCPATNPHYKYVQALANAGFSIGYEDGTFRPDKPLTREELLGIKIGVDVGKTLPPWRAQMENVWKFSDGKDVSERFTGYVHQDFYVSGPHGSNMQRAFGKIGAFHPKQPVLRYEAAGTLWQMGQFGDTTNTNVAAVLKEKAAKS